MNRESIIYLFKDFFKKWDQFWFQSGNLKSLGLMRLIICGNLFYMYLIRHIYNLDFFNESSFVSREMAVSVIPQFYRPNFVWFFWPDSMTSMIHAIFVFLIFLTFLGLSIRPLMLLTWILHLGFIQRNYAVLFGADLISCLFFFYLSWTPCCETFSLKRFIFKNIPTLKMDLLGSVFFRMAQIHLSVIYAYTGFEKLKGMTWWDGTALWSVFANPQMVIFDMTWTRAFPIFIAVISFFTIFWEIYWPAAILSQKTRFLWLGLGVLFHCGIGFLMALWNFAIVMMAVYPLFLSEKTIEKFFFRIKPR